MSEKTFKIVGDDISDGHRTFGELYEHRCLLYLNLCLALPDRCVWKKDYETWFCLYFESAFGQISYHLPDKFLPLVEGKLRRDDEYAWDGHTPEQVLERWGQLAKLQSSALILGPFSHQEETAVASMINKDKK